MKVTVFTGEHCIPCKRLKKELDKLVEEYPEVKVELKPTEDPDNLKEAQRLGIMAVPMSFVDDPQLKFAGYRSKADLIDMLELD